jgi:NADH:ubiquinone oxidoreductase subunit E
MKITVCIGSSCHLKGSREVVENLEKLVILHDLTDKIELIGSFCMDNCMKGVCVKLNDKLFSLTPIETEKFFKNEVLGRIK